MKKTELTQLIKAIVTEISVIKRERLAEAKKGLSGNTKTSGKTPNTKMKSDAKSITSTDKPKEKTEGTKLPVKEKKKNTETKHVVKKGATPKVPASEKKESTARPVGGKKPKKGSLKEMLVTMIRESLEAHAMEEMAKKPLSYDGTKLSGSISNNLRQQDASSPTGWVLASNYKLKDGTVVPAGAPVDAPANTGKNYIPKGNVGMGRPKTDSSGDSAAPATGLQVSVASADGASEEPLEFDFLNSNWPAAKKFLEANVMANLGDAAVDPRTKIGQGVYDAIEAAKEADLDGNLNNTNNRIVLYFDPNSKQLLAKK